MDNELVRDLKSEDCSPRAESAVHDMLRVLNRKVFSAKSETMVHALLNDLNREDLATRPGSLASEALKLSAIPLV